MTDPDLLHRAFWFLRHGETDWNRAHRTQGSTDIPLNETGLAQAHRAAAALHGQAIRQVISSPLIRARQTAEIVAATLDVPLRIEPDLREAAFGAHEGEVMGAWFAAWAAGEAIPEGGESFAAVKSRAIRAINIILATTVPTLLVAHGGLFRTVRSALGYSAAVRTPNGIPLLCTPTTTGWHISEILPSGGELGAVGAG